MQRINDNFLGLVEPHISLKNLTVLEIGCGDGQKTGYITESGACVTGIDPSKERITAALARKLPNATFIVGSADELPFNDHSFDVAMFTLSFHHIPAEQMDTVIKEAIRVVRPKGYIVFLEPGGEGAFFEAEKLFGLDEQKELAIASQTMQHHPGLKLVKENVGETKFKFDSLEDYKACMEPTRNLENIDAFLKAHKYALNAFRRVNIYQPR